MPKVQGKVFCTNFVPRKETKQDIMKKLLIAAFAMALGMGIMIARPAALQPGYVDLTTAAETSVNSGVYIKVTSGGKTQTVTVTDPFEDFFGDFFGFGFGDRGNGGRQQRKVQTPKRQAAGSGVIISKDGYIVTNNHVVKDADEIEVKLNDNREFTGRIIGLDETTDLALIKIDAKNLPAITIGSSDDLKVGQLQYETSKSITRHGKGTNII